MTPAEELAQAADKLAAQTNGACPCRQCKIDRALAEWLRSEAQAVRGGQGRGFDGVALYRANPRAMALARLIDGSAS